MNNITALVGTTRQQFASEKLTVILYLVAWKMIPATDSQAEIKKILCWLILNKPLPNLYSRNHSIHGTLSSVLRVSPEL